MSFSCLVMVELRRLNQSWRCRLAFNAPRVWYCRPPEHAIVRRMSSFLFKHTSLSQRCLKSLVFHRSHILNSSRQNRGKRSPISQLQAPRASLTCECPTKASGKSPASVFRNGVVAAKFRKYKAHHSTHGFNNGCQARKWVYK